MLPKNMKEGRVRVLSLRLRGLYRGALAKMFNNKLDVAMGAYDGAGVSELVGLFLLDEIIRADIGLKKPFLGIYRVDGLAVVRTSIRVLKK